MPSSTPILIPLENVNDPTVILLAWTVNQGDMVRAGQVIAEIETSKAVVELESPAAGRIMLIARAGDSGDVGAVIGSVIDENGTDDAETAKASSEVVASKPVRAPDVSISVPGVRFSRKAEELLSQHGLAAELFAGSTMVKEQDVLKLLEHLKDLEKSSTKVSPRHFALKDISLDCISLPAGLDVDDTEGTLDKEYLLWLQKNPAIFAAKSSNEKCEELRSHGAAIGIGVLIGSGSLIVAPRIVLRDDVVIGEGSRIQCRNAFVVGALSSFGNNLTVRGGTVVFGENVYGGVRIQIGGGGHADPWSLLAVGDQTFLGDDLFLNICRPVLLGREVFLTQRAILVTHNIGHSVLEGYENCFEPIVLEDMSQVGMATTLYAGVRIGRASIVASNSYVISNIPAGKLAVGVPAKVVRDAARPLTREAQVQSAQKMVCEFRELLYLKGHEVSEVVGDRFTLTVNGETIHLSFNEVWSATKESDQMSIIWTFGVDGSPVRTSMVFDLLHKTVSGPMNLLSDSAREFLRKRGIRFQPGPWRYRTGLI